MKEKGKIEMEREKKGKENNIHFGHLWFAGLKMYNKISSPRIVNPETNNPFYSLYNYVCLIG